MRINLRFLLAVLTLLASGGLRAQFYASSGAIVSVTAANTLYATGDVNLASGSSTTLAGTLQLGGSLTNSGTTTGSSGTLSFTGSAAQSFGGSALTVGNLVVNNSSGGLTFNAPLTVGTATTFTNGLVFSSAANPLIYASGASPGSPTDASHVSGPVQYLGATAFTYPVGDATYYRPVDVNLSANGSGLTAAYTRGDATTGPGNATYQAPLAGVSKMEYWTFTPVSTATATVTLNWDASKVSPGISNATGVTALRVAHFNGTQWLNEGGTASGTYNGTGTITSGSISSWSPFALGTTDLINAPLPLNFLGISAMRQSDGSRLISWGIAQELNVKNYIVERSTDGSSYTDAGTVIATGSQGQQIYSLTDGMVLNSSVVYYRVVAVDMDGHMNYSNTVAVGLQSAGGDIHVTPNPVNSNLQISFGNNMKGDYEMDILSSNGAVLYSKNLLVTDNSTIVVNRPGGIMRGVYVVRLIRSGDGQVSSFKLIFE